MKSYKFLKLYYKSIFKSTDFEVKTFNCSEDNLLYNQLLDSVASFKKEVAYDCKCIDRYLDFILLNGKISSTTDLDEQANSLAKFMNMLSVEDFRKFRMFRLFIEREYKTLIINNRNISTLSIYTHVYISSSLFMIECGLIYEPIQVNKNIKINLSKYLDALIKVDLNYINTNGVDLSSLFGTSSNKKLSKSATESFLINCISGFNKISFGVYTDFLDRLDKFCHCMYVKGVSDLLLNKIPKTDFKFCLSDYLEYFSDPDLGNRKYTNFTDRFVIDNECIDWFRDRNFLIPESGILIDNGGIKTIACECYDEICGYSIYYSTSIEDLELSTIDVIHLQYSLSSATRCHLALQNLYVVYGLYDTHVRDNGVKFIPSFVEVSEGSHTWDCLKVDYEPNLGKVLLPSYWSNRGTNHVAVKKDPKSSNNFIGTKIELIKPFKKKLPEGFRRSDHATRLAKELCINLEENETVVSQFIRERKIKNV